MYSLSLLARVLWRHIGTHHQHCWASHLSLAHRTTFIGRPEVLTLPESRLPLWTGETGVYEHPQLPPLLTAITLRCTVYIDPRILQ